MERPGPSKGASDVTGRTDANHLSRRLRPPRYMRGELGPCAIRFREIGGCFRRPVRTRRKILGRRSREPERRHTRPERHLLVVVLSNIDEAPVRDIAEGLEKLAAGG